MYGIRSKKTKEFLKIITSYHASDDEAHSHFTLHFSTRIEINYYVNDSLGFISNILLRESEGYNYEPELDKSIDQNELEVVNLITNEVVALDDVLDGQDVDQLPEFKKDEDNDEIEIEFERF